MRELKRILPMLPVLTGKQAHLLLGTDEYIGEGLDEFGELKQVETRVGIIPEQVLELKAFLESKGVALDFSFLKGCGVRAGYTDSSFLNAGGKLVFENELPDINTPDVVHALKEPTHYESFIPGPFLRIGALHSGAFDSGTGVALLLKKRNFAAIFDGSNIGEGRNIPIRGAMSVFAGEIAAEQTIEHLRKSKVTDPKIVISGGGIVGQACLSFLLREIHGAVDEIIIIEPFESTVATLKSRFGENRAVTIIQASSISDTDIVNADGLVLAAFAKGKSAPQVIQLHQLETMQNGGIVVDVAIDEKGGISIPGLDKQQHTLKDVVLETVSAVSELDTKITYLGDDHMPKNKPQKASLAHGAAILPYLALLLYYSAKLGGARSAARYIQKGNFSDAPDEVKIHLMYLQNGLALYNPAPIFLNPDVIGNKEERTAWTEFLNDQNIVHDELG